MTEVERFRNIIKDGYKLLDNSQAFVNVVDRIKASEDYCFMLSMLEGVKNE